MLQCYVLVISLMSAGSRPELGPGSFCLDFKALTELSIAQDVTVSNITKPSEAGLLNQTADSRCCECSFRAVCRKRRIFKQGIVIPESAKFVFCIYGWDRGN